jgi:AhpD family alkylhydroperoxidase
MTIFTVHTPKSGPEKSREILKSWQDRMGFSPNVLGVIAESPAVLKAFSDIYSALEKGSFNPAELVVINMTISYANGSNYCLAAHTTWAEKAGIPRDVLEKLRNDQPLKDVKLEALRQFTRSLLKKMGRADEKDLNDFYKAGYTKAHVLEVILGVSLNTIGNYVNHIAAPVLDKAFEPNRVEGKKAKDGRASNAA